MQTSSRFRSPWLVAVGVLCLCMVVPCESSAKGKADWKELKQAVKGGELRQVEALLDDGVDPDAKSGPKQKTSLMVAVKHGHTEIAKLLIDKGADVNAVCNEFFATGWRPLHFAASFGNRDVTAWLLEGGAEPDTTNEAGQTPLMIAAGSGDTAITGLLVDAGADVEVANFYGATPLHIAVFNGYEETASVLASAGANLDSRLNDDETLIERGQTPLITAELLGRVPIAEMLIDKGADVDLPDLEGKTPLYHAVNLGLEGLPERLIEAGAEVSVLEETGTDLFVTAGSFRVLADFNDRIGSKDEAMELYARAAEYYDRASPALIEHSEDYRKLKKKANRKSWVEAGFGSVWGLNEAEAARKGFKELEQECVERSQHSVDLAAECRESAGRVEQTALASGQSEG